MVDAVANTDALAFRYPLKFLGCTCAICLRVGVSSERLALLDNLPSVFQRYSLVKLVPAAVNSQSNTQATPVPLTATTSTATPHNPTTATTEEAESEEPPEGGPPLLSASSSSLAGSLSTPGDGQMSRTPGKRGIPRYEVAMTEEDQATFAAAYPQQAFSMQGQASPLQQLWVRSALKIVKQIKKLKAATLFLHPVDYVALNLPDYPSIIKHPMDLTTVENKLNGTSPFTYTQPDLWVSDMRLIWLNCITCHINSHHRTHTHLFPLHSHFHQQSSALLLLPTSFVEQSAVKCECECECVRVWDIDRSIDLRLCLAVDNLPAHPVTQSAKECSIKFEQALLSL